MIFLAWKQLRHRPWQSALVLMGIAMGCAGYLAFSGIMLGLKDSLTRQLLDNMGHVVISAREGAAQGRGVAGALFAGGLVSWRNKASGRDLAPQLEDPGLWMRLLSADPEVEAFSPQMAAVALLQRGGASKSLRLLGVDPAKEARTTSVSASMVEGSFGAIAGGASGVVLGRTLADKMGLALNDYLSLQAPGGLRLQAQVAGLFHSGIRDLDENRAYVSLALAQQLAGRPGQIGQIVVKLRDFSGAGAKAEAWSRLGRDQVQGWEEANANFMTVFKIQDASRYVLVAVILLVAGFGIYNVLSALVNAKRGEIAILRSMGFEPGQLVRLFLIQGLGLGAAGGILGTVLGAGAGLAIASLRFGSPIGMSGSDRLAVVLDPSMLAVSMGLALGVGALASALPAWRASRLGPIDVLRGEG